MGNQGFFRRYDCLAMPKRYYNAIQVNKQNTHNYFNYCRWEHTSTCLPYKIHNLIMLACNVTTGASTAPSLAFVGSPLSIPQCTHRRYRSDAGCDAAVCFIGQSGNSVYEWLTE